MDVKKIQSVVDCLTASALYCVFDSKWEFICPIDA